MITLLKVLGLILTLGLVGCTSHLNKYTSADLDPSSVNFANNTSESSCIHISGHETANEKAEIDDAESSTSVVDAETVSMRRVSSPNEFVARSANYWERNSQNRGNYSIEDRQRKFPSKDIEETSSLPVVSEQDDFFRENLAARRQQDLQMEKWDRLAKLVQRSICRGC